MDKKLVFGIGTGRCGTVSLSKLLNSQKNSNFTHEIKPLLPWKFSKNEINKKLNQIIKRKPDYVGDIAFYYLPYVEYIIKKYPHTKFICLKRDKNETVESYDNKTGLKNHWINHDGKKFMNDPYDKCFPKNNDKSLLKKQLISRYYDKYYSEVERLIKKYPNNILLFEMTYGLNTKKGINEILDFLEFPKNNRNIKKSIKSNKYNLFILLYYKILSFFRN